MKSNSVRFILLVFVVGSTFFAVNYYSGSTFTKTHSEGFSAKKVLEKSYRYEIKGAANYNDSARNWYFNAQGKLDFVTDKALGNFLSSVDLSVNGKPCKYARKRIVYKNPVIVNSYCRHKDGSFGQVQVFDEDGSILWEKRFAYNVRVVNVTSGHILIYYRNKHDMFVDIVSFPNFETVTYDSLDTPYLGQAVFLSGKKQLIFSRLDNQEVYRYDFDTRTSEKMLSANVFFGYNEVQDMQIDASESYLYMATERTTRGPSKWIGFFVYDLEKDKFVYSEKFADGEGHVLRDGTIAVFPNQEIGFQYADGMEQQEYFIKYQVEIIP